MYGEIIERYYLLEDVRIDGRPDWIVAPPGYYRTKDGRYVKDGSLEPEHGPRELAHHFKTHLAAARVARRLANPLIHVCEEL